MIVRKINIPVVEPEAIPQLFADHGINYNDIACNNWPKEYPYTPKVQMAIAHCGSHILLHYKVEEKTVRAVNGEDLGSVWQDSCVEFFSSPAYEEDGIYYNMEFNCIGSLLLCQGAGRPNRERADKSVLSGVKRWSSLGRAPFEEHEAPACWELAVAIPVTAYYKHHIDTFDGLRLRANFYKCGDLLSTVHFLSWAPISVPSPDFHRPEFFKELEFQSE